MFQAIKHSLNYIFEIQKKNTIVFIFLLIVSTFLEGLSISLVYPIIEIILNKNNSNFWPFFENTLKFNYQAIYLIGFIVSIYILKSIFLIFFTWWRSSFLTKLNSIINIKLFSKYLDMSYEKYLKTDSSVLLRNCHEEARKYVGCIEASLLIFIELFTFGIILIPLMYFNFFSTILILSILIIFSLFYILITKIFINKWAKRQVYLVAETFKTLKHSFQLFKYIKLKNKKNFFFNRYNVAVNEYQNCIRNFTFTKQLPKYLIETILIVLISSVFLVNYSDSSSISKIIPLLALYTAAALRLIPGLNRILSYVQVIYNSIPSLKILHHDLTNSSKLISNDKQNYIEKIKKLTFSDKIEIKNLSYKYEGSSQKIINNLNITIKKGEKICITGESGQGKTTFIDLLTGLLRPNSGEIIVDGKKIIDHLDDWKKLINFTPQSVTLISDSLEKNITLNENSSQEIQRKAYEALKNSHFNKLKNDEIFNLSLTIGEEAKGLSGGQAQRVAIARSLYEKGEIFIFDEFTSSLDQETSQKVLENIFKILKGKTIIIISHRPQLSHYFDVIYKLENKNNITLLKKV